ncbi:hypothetical protein A3C89_01685 [Candidatus Kaiserbacteria bacterium RIFCSPHIGHO2_02_FULL_50_50]|uniref:NAD-dependent epimerase/dehydratase domain-containing protein n=1 Tax=Candidatus Kaiserbacteria bacterium RIFCSPHIGHO2_02_FULL_50_50 TaxID=1798492 RepID=A0A1F6DCK3_9BACT|nr:MAG: hypothetical protein A3C89_01685 [Candidatus Kaiserbacteria bacterium RIFCSPHIGHO2_02_FULL_50_50]OGG88295.1 MAG: hypothetical protein A3G62_03295 [Candidatus Kaiserbacteria bacterium RIFCSPLOWO2_12_FULL_50_10]
MRTGTILLTGATGYLGSKLLHALLKDGYSMIVLKRSFSDTFRIHDVLTHVLTHDVDNQELESLFENHNIETIIHCATDYGRKVVDPMQVIEANLLLPVRLLELARKHKVRHFINTDTILDKRMGHYSLSKHQFCDWLHSYKNYMLCTNVVLGHFYGSGDDATKFVSLISEKLLSNAPYIELTEGAQLRNFIHVDDVVDAFLRIVTHRTTHTDSFEEYHVCGEENISIKNLVLLMQELSGNVTTELRFGAIPYRDNEVMTYNIDTTALQKLGWKASYSLAEGLKKMIAEDSSRIK